ncbi:DUF5718 family protein [Aeromonas veronii]|uniref:DUF5718 family protein n=1 Tax=Aeromonas veronii TaxID=654 RepID=A0AAW5MA12_AERVE|nr:DUF5718 family protein [Aeromonas veronii]ELV7508965.1 hypothetical protein [Aeromonas veronii]MCR4447587.1 DUF5718 family protein [Aeromonas veronii]MCR6553573.1 DUF5718 family protein [Aeromonas sp. CPF2-S1]
MQIAAESKFIGLGVAGNFAGHLEQAGEASDFVAVVVRDTTAPKALFPFFVPGHPGQLGVFPLSDKAIFLPEAAVSGDEKVQIEPEVALWCELEYAGKQVVAIHPRAFGAYNDCSIRRPNAKKISEKKNWDEASKGLAANLLPLSGFAAGCELDDYRIACYLERDGELHAYGVDSAAIDYSYFHGKLLDWAIDKFNHQQDEGPAEHIQGLLAQAGHPPHALISIGATRYTPFGETHFLKPGDTSCVVVYPGSRYSEADIREAIRSRNFGADMSVLLQAVQAR